MSNKTIKTIIIFARLILLIIIIFVSQNLVNQTTKHQVQANTKKNSPPKLTTSYINNNAHFYGLFAEHQQKIQTIGDWTYSIYTFYNSNLPPITAGSNAPAKWALTRSKYGQNWENIYFSNDLVSYQPPVLLQLPNKKLVVIYAGDKQKGLYSTEFLVNLDGTVSLIKETSIIPQSSSLISYYSAEADPQTGNIVVFYWNGSKQSFTVRRVNQKWQTPQVFGTANPKIAFYPLMRWDRSPSSGSNGKLHLLYMHGSLGGASGNYWAIYHVQSIDNGKTWQNSAGKILPQNLLIGQENTQGADLISHLSNSQHQILHSAITDKLGNLHIIYSDSNNQSPYHGKNWYRKIRPNGTISPLSPIDTRYLTVDNQFNPPILYGLSLKTPPSEEKLNFQYQKSKNSGDNWEPVSEKITLPWTYTFLTNNYRYNYPININLQQETTKGMIKMIAMLRNISFTDVYNCQKNPQGDYCSIISIFFRPTKLSPTFNSSDLNQDSHVNIFDYNLFVADFGKSGSPGWIKADIDKNGKTDIFDYNILISNFES